MVPMKGLLGFMQGVWTIDLLASVGSRERDQHTRANFFRTGELQHLQPESSAAWVLAHMES